MRNLAKYRYTILSYAPTALSEPDAACFVIAEDLSNTEHPKINVFVPTQFDKNISEDHRQYIAELVRCISSTPDSDMGQFLLGIQDLSVGPLRVGFIDNVSQSSLHEVIGNIFKTSGYLMLR